MTTEAQIQADVEALRTQIADTQALYREVCAVLFFRHGIAPTANKLYQYVRKGSMSAPATALAKFWGDLREKSRVRIEHPDLPETLRTAAGDLVAKLWTQAQSAAREGQAAYQAEAQAQAEAAYTAQVQAEVRVAEAQAALETMQQTVQAAVDRNLQLERDLAAEQASKEALAQQLETARRRQVTLDAGLADARRDFATELEKLRQALQRSEERIEAAEKRGLLEIDRERTAAMKLQKEQARWQGEAGEARQKLGMAEGTLQELRATFQHQTAEMLRLQQELISSKGRVSALEQEVRRFRVTHPFVREESGLRRRPKPGSR